MEVDDPRLIVTLEAVSATAERAWNQPQNQDRCPPASDDGVRNISSREATPVIERHGSRLQLNFDNKPKNLEKGFVFGSDPQVCDVFLGERGAGFSRKHFRISFNERRQVIFVNTSREARVSYDGEILPDRTHFAWILFNHYENIKVEVGKEDLIFKVKWPKIPEDRQAEYDAHRDAYLEECRNALPALSQLGFESQQTTALLTAQRSPRQQPIYLPEEELGHGSFGTVHKVVDVSTGYEYAGKIFHGGEWKKEIEILKSLSHKYIVEFVDFSEEKSMLVMEYLSLGNLACQYYITEEENLQILCQGLQVLEYLHSHSPPLAHRDIKPTNILIRSRIPFVIKLVDFGLANNDSTLKTFCGSDEYAAPEVWERHHYTEMVDIWSLGVVVLKYGYGLPRPSHKCKGMPWCRDIVKKTEDMKGDGNALIDPISVKMLRMDYRHRQSASDCLKEVYRLGFHAIQTVEIGRTTPTEKTTGRDGVTRTKSIIMQPLQNAPSDSDVTSGFYDVGGTSELTEVAPSKRDLREGINFYNRASPTSLDRYPQGPTQIWNPQIEDNPTSMLSKRRRPQLNQSPTADALGRGRSKRSRASISCEVGEQLSKTLDPRQGFEQLERSICLNHEGKLATDVASLIQDVEPIPEVTPKPTRKPTRRPLGRSSVPAKEVSLREIEKPSEFFAINASSHPIFVRKSDFRINASQIFRAAGRLSHLRRKPEWAYDIVKGGNKHRGTYVDFKVGLKLCQKYDLAILEKELRSLQPPSPVPTVSPPPVVKLPPAGFLRVDHLSETVMVLQKDFKINASNLLRVAGCPRRDMMAITRGLPADSYKHIAGRSPVQGTYVIFTTGIELCRRFELVDLEKQLLDLKSTSKEPVSEVTQNRIVRQLFENISSQPISTELNQAQTSRGPVSDGPTQPGHTYEIESDSDISGSDTGLPGKIQPNKANSIPSGGESPPARNSHYATWNSEGTSGFTQAPRSLGQTEPVTYLDQISMPTITLDNGQVPGPLVHGSSNLNRGDTGKISSLTQSDLRSNSSWASTVGKGVTYPGHYDDPTVETSF